MKNGGFNSASLQDEDGKSLTDEEIQAEANTFMFAGELICCFYNQGTVMLGNTMLKVILRKNRDTGLFSQGSKNENKVCSGLGTYFRRNPGKSS